MKKWIFLSSIIEWKQKKNNLSGNNTRLGNGFKLRKETNKLWKNADTIAVQQFLVCTSWDTEKW